MKVEVNGKTYCVETLIADNERLRKEVIACAKTNRLVLDSVRAEIEQTVSRYSISRERGCMGQVEWSDRLIKESEVLQIIDRHIREDGDKE